jgi:peptidoglycan/LPS O-acetylase OafA/YrhL
MESTKPDRRIQELDALRLFAAVAVVFYHLTYSNSASRQLFPMLDWITRYGYLGVDLFFVISGFVILWSAQGRSLWQFGVSRVARLYPLFWLALAMSAWVVPEVTLTRLAANATMVAGYLGQNYIDGVYWTLQVELKFYVLVGLLLAFRQGKNFELWISVWLAASIGAEFIPALRSAVIYPYSPLFIGGAVCFLVRSNGFTWWRLALFLTAGVLATLHAGPASKGFVLGTDGTVAYIVVACIFVAAWLVAIDRLRLRCSAYAAAMTYPLYLVHNELGRALFRSLEAWGIWMSLSVTLVVVFALAFGLSLLDKPLGNYVKRGAEWLRTLAMARVLKRPVG